MRPPKFAFPFCLLLARPPVLLIWGWVRWTIQPNLQTRLVYTRAAAFEILRIENTDGCASGLLQGAPPLPAFVAGGWGF